VSVMKGPIKQLFKDAGETLITFYCSYCGADRPFTVDYSGVQVLRWDKTRRFICYCTKCSGGIYMSDSFINEHLL